MRKALILIVCSLMLIVSGCGNTERSSEISETSSSSAAEAVSNEETVYETVAPPEGGWTTEEIMNVTYFCGHRLSYPLSLDELGDDFSLAKYSRSAARKRLVPATLRYKGKSLGNATTVTVDNKRMIYNLVLFPEVCEVTEVEPFVINGIKMYDTIEEVEAALGEPYYKSEESLMYNDRETNQSLYSFFFEDGKLVHFNNDFRFEIDLPLYRKMKEREEGLS